MTEFTFTLESALLSPALIEVSQYMWLLHSFSFKLVPAAAAWSGHSAVGRVQL